MRVPSLVGMDRTATTGPAWRGEKVTRSRVVDPAARWVPTAGCWTEKTLPGSGVVWAGGGTAGPAVRPVGTVVEVVVAALPVPLGRGPSVLS